jgi:hypothetical protein
LGISVPLIIIAFNVDRIAYLFDRMRGLESNILHSIGRMILLLVALAVPPSILAPIWTSELSTGAKIAATTVLATLGLAVLFSIGIWYLTHAALRTIRAPTLSTTMTGSS